MLVSAALLLGVASPAQADPRVGGEIGYAYDYSYGGSGGFLGNPTTGEVRTPNGKGAYVVFQGGSVYWSPWTGAHEVHGEIRNGYARTGWENGLLGFPVTDELTSDSRRAKFQRFEGGVVLWTPWTGAHEMHGAIRAAYNDFYTYGEGYDVAEAEDVLGFPTSDEIRTPDGRGAYNTFQWGSIYWSPGSGAHAVYGAIRDAWAGQGYENGRLGFPLEDEYVYEEGIVVQNFEGGLIAFDPFEGRAHVFPGEHLWD
ncbi:hypothetical protein GCM10009528_24300 [Kineococcus aurantiacus]